MGMILHPISGKKGPPDIQTETDQICQAVATTKACYPDLDLIVFTEHSAQALNASLWT